MWQDSAQRKEVACGFPENDMPYLGNYPLVSRSAIILQSNETGTDTTSLNPLISVDLIGSVVFVTQWREMERLPAQGNHSFAPEAGPFLENWLHGQAPLTLHHWDIL